ncbi:MAG TPA: hypothetical protein VMT53_00490 [Terriglobales bacterium]|nr:hypothetical protein [Terriglobales bacterium]
MNDAEERLRAWQDEGWRHRGPCFELMANIFPDLGTPPEVASIIAAPSQDKDPVVHAYNNLINEIDGLRNELPAKIAVGTLPRTSVWALSEPVGTDGWLIAVPLGLMSYLRAFAFIFCRRMQLVRNGAEVTVSLDPHVDDDRKAVSTLLGSLLEIGWPSTINVGDRLSDEDPAVQSLYDGISRVALDFILLHELLHAVKRHSQPERLKTTLFQEAGMLHNEEFEADVFAFSLLLTRYSRSAKQAYLGISLLFHALSEYERFGGGAAAPNWLSHPPVALRFDRLRRSLPNIVAQSKEISAPLGFTARQLVDLEELLGRYVMGVCVDMLPSSPLNEIFHRATKEKDPSRGERMFIWTNLIWLALGDPDLVMLNLRNVVRDVQNWQHDTNDHEGHVLGASYVRLIEKFRDLLMSEPRLSSLVDKLD